VSSELLDCKQTEQIKHDLKWLAAKLGPVRDLDVSFERQNCAVRGRGFPDCWIA
jgi:CHAD domain-containing protein